MQQVSIWKCDSYDYHQLRTAICSLLEPLGGMAAFVRPGQRVLLKPNMLSAKRPEQAVTTNPVLVQIVCELVKDCGCTVLIGDSPGIGGFQKVAEKSGIAGAATASNARLAPFEETVELQGDDLFKRITVAKVYWEADVVINLPKLKTHEMMTMTCAVKNLFGAVVGAEKAGWHLKAGESRSRFARLLLDIYLLKKPALNIVDGILAMEGNGPGNGDPVQRGILLAGVNPLAVDLIAGELAGIPGDLLPVLQEAKQMGLPGTEQREIELLGMAMANFATTPFRLPSGLDTQFGLPKFLNTALKRHLTAYPHADKEKCVLCGICRDACPPAAITIQNSALIVDQRRCIRCWCCRELCPHDAMAVRRGIVARSLEMLRKRQASSSSPPSGISR